jgi:hypothetical protein
MQMKHRLPRATAVVKHSAVTRGKVPLSSEFCGDKLQLPQHGRILRAGIGERNQMLARAQ